MHYGGEPLLLPNVWDVASARIVEEAGFPALATSSGGVAFSLGYPDGQRIHKDRMMAAVARIAQAVKAPLLPMSNRATGTIRKLRCGLPAP